MISQPYRRHTWLTWSVYTRWFLTVVMLVLQGFCSWSLLVYTVVFLTVVMLVLQGFCSWSLLVYTVVFLTVVMLVLQGFCSWSLVVFDRLLIPSNPALGVVRYKDNYYAFSSQDAAYEFCNAPDRLARFLPLIYAFDFQQRWGWEWGDKAAGEWNWNGSGAGRMH